MPCLDDPKHERFASLVSSGKTQRFAYNSIGYRSKNPDSAASRLANNPKVKARIRELMERVSNKVNARTAETVATTKAWVLTKLRENAEKALAVEGGSAVANRALELLGKELGLFREPEVKPPMKLEDLPEEVLASMLAEAEANAAK